MKSLNWPPSWLFFSDVQCLFMASDGAYKQPQWEHSGRISVFNFSRHWGTFCFILIGVGTAAFSSSTSGEPWSDWHITWRLFLNPAKQSASMHICCCLQLLYILTWKLEFQGKRASLSLHTRTPFPLLRPRSPDSVYTNTKIGHSYIILCRVTRLTSWSRGWYTATNSHIHS